MKFKAILFLVTAIVGSTFAQIPTAEFDKLLSEQYKSDGPGATVLVAQKGRIVYHKAFGMANLELGVPLQPDHVLRIGSVTKQFTAVAILQLVEQGKLSLQDELTKFIPDYPTQGKRIIVEHLLTHTSGIKSYTGMKEWDPATHRKDFTPTELVDYFKNQPMDFDPGEQWEYNNSGYVLLGVIIEKVSGQTYAEYLDEHIFKPLGMKHTYYDVSTTLIPNRAAGYSQADVAGAYANSTFLSMTQPYAAGSLLSTVEDLFIWTKAVHEGKVVRPDLLKKAFTPYILPDGSSTRYGYGWALNNLLGSPTIEHSGGIHGFLSDLVYLPNEEICVAILTNCDCNPPGNVANKIAALAAGKTIAPTPIVLDAQALEEYVGVYENDKNEQRVITIDQGELYSQRAGGSKLKLIPYGKDQFYFEGPLARATFLREKNKVVKVSVNDRNAPDNIWVKTDKPLPAARPEIQRTEAQLEPFVGEYQLAPGFNIAITREGAQLFCQATGQERFELFAATPTRFFLKVVEADIEFYPDANGAVPKMTLFQGGQEMPGERIK